MAQTSIILKLIRESLSNTSEDHHQNDIPDSLQAEIKQVISSIKFFDDSDEYKRRVTNTVNILDHNHYQIESVIDFCLDEKDYEPGFLYMPVHSIPKGTDIVRTEVDGTIASRLQRHKGSRYMAEVMVHLIYNVILPLNINTMNIASIKRGGKKSCEELVIESWNILDILEEIFPLIHSSIAYTPAKSNDFKDMAEIPGNLNKGLSPSELYEELRGDFDDRNYWVDFEPFSWWTGENSHKNKRFLSFVESLRRYYSFELQQYFSEAQVKVFLDCLYSHEENRHCINQTMRSLQLMAALENNINDKAIGAQDPWKSTIINMYSSIRNALSMSRDVHTDDVSVDLARFKKFFWRVWNFNYFFLSIIELEKKNDSCDEETSPSQELLSELYKVFDQGYYVILPIDIKPGHDQSAKIVFELKSQIEQSVFKFFAHDTFAFVAPIELSSALSTHYFFHPPNGLSWGFVTKHEVVFKKDDVDFEDRIIGIEDLFGQVFVSDSRLSLNTTKSIVPVTFTSSSTGDTISKKRASFILYLKATLNKQIDMFKKLLMWSLIILSIANGSLFISELISYIVNKVFLPSDQMSVPIALLGILSSIFPYLSTPLLASHRFFSRNVIYKMRLTIWTSCVLAFLNLLLQVVKAIFTAFL